MVIVTVFLIGYRSRMRATGSTFFLTIFLAAILCVTAGCAGFHKPRITDEPRYEPPIPVTVRMVFDDSVQKSTLEQSACADTLWTGQLGEAVVHSFRAAGIRRFAEMRIQETVEKARTTATSPLSDVTAVISLTEKSLKSRTRTGSGDNYLVELDVKLAAAFQDANGRSIADAPLVYSNQVNIYTPQYGGSGQCATQQLDEAMTNATDYLAQQFVGYVAELTMKSQQRIPAGRQVASGAVPAGELSALTVRATLLDENNNLILEGGEKVGIRLDVTNNGANPVGPSTVSFSGTPALIDAFSGAAAAQTQLAGLQPGATTSAILWGKLPDQLEGPRGELTVTVTPSGDATGAAAAQTLVASIASRPASSIPVPATQPAKPGPSVSANGQHGDRYAVIVGLSLYRSPWPGWKDGLSFEAKEATSMFAATLGVPEGNILLLQDELAGQTDIEEALTTWLPKRVGKDSVVFFYFAGQTVANPKNGEVFLIPYDSTPASTTYRLISLRYLQSRLEKLGAKVTVAMLDTPVTMGSSAKDTKAPKAVLPNWVADLDGSAGPNGTTLVQVSRLPEASRKQTNLLSGLAGSADLDHDGVITLGEWLRSLRGTAVTVPRLPPPLSVQSIPLAHVNNQSRAGK